MVKYLIGIDEVGRGPIAGHLTVAIVCVREDLNMKLLKGVKDSKHMTEKKREEWYEKTCVWKKGGIVNYKVSFVSSPVVDRIGISKATDLAIKRCLKDIKHRNCHVMLDGLLYAPERFKSQETITKGDQKEPLISLASVIAKVRRDRRMCMYSERFPEYKFHKHKGYGTKEHYKALKKHGLSSLHRRSFLKGVVDKNT